MREIKFRALAAVNDKHAGIKKGDMVYGQFIQSGVDAPCVIFGDGEQIEIDKETLGQFTGLTTESGQDLYLGDIGEFENGDRFVLTAEDWLEVYVGWIGEPKCEDQARDLYRTTAAKVIGNIHQHPELMESDDE